MNLAASDWHVCSVDQILSEFATATGGLSQVEAERRLRQFGLNRLPCAPSRGPLKRFAAQFHDVLIYVLLGATGVPFLLGEWLDSVVIPSVVLINTLIGFVQVGQGRGGTGAG